MEKTEDDFNLILLDANDRYLEHFGEVRDRGTNELYRRNLLDNAEVISEQKGNILSGEPLHFVVQVRDLRDQTFWLQVNAGCVDWQGGGPVYFAILIDITDVTQLRRMQKKLTEQTEALKDALAVAERANHAKTDFLSRMSHEIRHFFRPLQTVQLVVTAAFLLYLLVVVQAVKLAVLEAVFVLLGPGCLEDRRQRVTEVYRADFAPLGGADLRLVPCPVVAHTAPHRDGLLLEVNVLPCEGADLADPKPGLLHCLLFETRKQDSEHLPETPLDSSLCRSR